MKKRIIVTGGSGFIGTNFIKTFLAENDTNEVINLDALTYSGNSENHIDTVEKYGKRYQFIYGSIVDPKVIEYCLTKHYPINHIISFAAETHVDRSIHVGAKEFIDTNVIGVYNLLEAIGKEHFMVEKYIQVSTDEAFGDTEQNNNQPFTEETSFRPNVPYSATKAAGDLLCRAYHSTFGTPVIVTHCSNNYGPYQYPEKLIPFFVLRMLEGKTLPIYGDGKQIRDWIHVSDHVAALRLLIDKGIPGEVYNIGADNEQTNWNIAILLQTIMSELGHKSTEIETVADRPGHDRRYAINTAKIRSLGWYPRKNFNKAMRQTVQWYLNNPDWIRHIQIRTSSFNPHIK